MANNVIDLLTVNPTAAYHIKGIINLYTVNFMVDTGEAVSLLDSKIWNRVKESSNELVQPWVGWSWGYSYRGLWYSKVNCGS